MKKTYRLGSRGSPLALLQAEEVRKLLLSSHPDLAGKGGIEIVPISTSGDWRPEHKEQSFRDLGGNKELFTKEIDEALLSGAIDMAVHSMKDVSTWLPQGIEIMAVLQRVDPRDAFLGRTAKKFEDLPQGATIGTSSLRRQAQILVCRPDLKIVPMRGNVETRLKKLADGKADATLLALAGLTRLGLQDRVSSVLSTDVMLPAAAQGAVGVAARTEDSDMRRLLQPLDVRESHMCVTAERALLNKLDGSCDTPIGALARIIADRQIEIEGLVAKPDGTSLVRMKISGAAGQAEQLGETLGARIKAQLPPDFFAA
jgi:hydroxymethylbilane synthase